MFYIFIQYKFDSISFMNFRTMYNVLEQDENMAVIELCGKEHPVFKAHFPSKPILPGFIHFDVVEELFFLKIKAIKKAKFLGMVAPGEKLRYERNINKFKVFSSDKEVANFSL